MRNFLIIGGSSGIGKVTVELLADKDDNIIASYNKNEISRKNVQYFHHDVLIDCLDVEQLPDELHGLVYCPGSINLKAFKRFSEDDFIHDFKLQVTGAIKTIQAVLPMLKKGKGSIVLYSTVAVQKGFGFHSQVAVSKGAIEGLTKSLAAEFAPHIRVNCIAPSLTDTSLAGMLLKTDEKRDKLAQQNPLHRIGEPIDIAEMTVYLLSNKAKWITGQIIHIDGGASVL